MRLQEWDGITQDLLWLFQWDFPNFPLLHAALRGAWLGEWLSCFALLSCVWPLHFICSELIPLSSSAGINLLLMGAVLHHQHSSRTLMTALAPALFAAVWVPGASGTSPCTAAVAGGSQPGRSCPCSFLSRDPAQCCGAAPLPDPLGLPPSLPPLSACHSVPFLIHFGCWKHHFCLLCAPRCL